MAFVSITPAKINGNTDTTPRIFDVSKMIGVRADSVVPTALRFKYPSIDAGGSPTYDDILTGTLSLTTLLNNANSNAPAGTSVYIGVVSSASGFSIGAHDLLDINGNVITLPANTFIWDAAYEVTTTFTSATDAATISFGVATDAATGLKAATAISTGTTYDDVNALVAFTPVGTVGTATTKTSAARNVQYTIAVETVTAGKLYCFLECITTGA